MQEEKCNNNNNSKVCHALMAESPKGKLKNLRQMCILANLLTTLL
jgi:hypothetical protein